MIFLFWDKVNEEFCFFGEDGEFYLYGEDSVAKEQDPKNYEGYWMRSHKMQEITPLNEWYRHDFYCEKTGDWIEWICVDKETLKAVHKHARDPDWHLAHERA